MRWGANRAPGWDADDERRRNADIGYPYVPPPPEPCTCGSELPATVRYAQEDWGDVRFVACDRCDWQRRADAVRNALREE